MRITVKIKPNSKEEKVEALSAVEFSARIKAPPREGKANEALIELLAEYFGIAKGRISIVRGHKGREKIVDII